MKINKFLEYLYKKELKIKKKIYNGLLRNTAQSRFFNAFWMDSIQQEQTINYYENIPLSIEKAYRNIRQLYKNKIALPFFDLSVCSCCTLKCTQCSQWFPYLENKKIFKADKIIQDLDKLFKYVDIVHNVAVIGGEPLLNPELDKILEYLKDKAAQGKITYIRMVTNGTIMPSKKILEFFKHKPFKLIISHYPLEKIGNIKFIENRNNLLKYIEENNDIRYDMPENHIWEDYGTPTDAYNRTDTELYKIYSTCRFHGCKGLYDGKLYICGRAYAIEQLLKKSLRNDEFIDLSKINNKHDMKKAIKQLYSCDYSNACDYCNDIKSRKPIEPAHQIQPNNNQEAYRNEL